MAGMRETHSRDDTAIPTHQPATRRSGDNGLPCAGNVRRKVSGTSEAPSLAWDHNKDGYYTKWELEELHNLVRVERRKEHELAMTRGPRQGIDKWRRCNTLLDSSANGDVYEALFFTGEVVCVKQARMDSPQAENQVAALWHEIEILQRLRHQNVASFIGISCSVIHPPPTFLMELCAGGSIATVMKNFGALEEAVIRNFSGQILCALDYLHRHQIVHNDLRCSNCLLTEDGVVKLAHFGASIHLVEGGSVSPMRSSKHHTAPEARNGEPVGRQRDVWSLGTCVVEMFCDDAALASQLSTQFALLRRLSADGGSEPKMPEAISWLGSDLIRECFTINPAKRPSAHALRDHPFITGQNHNVHAAVPWGSRRANDGNIQGNIQNSEIIATHQSGHKEEIQDASRRKGKPQDIPPSPTNDKSQRKKMSADEWIRHQPHATSSGASSSSNSLSAGLKNNASVDADEAEDGEHNPSRGTSRVLTADLRVTNSASARRSSASIKVVNHGSTSRRSGQSPKAGASFSPSLSPSSTSVPRSLDLTCAVIFNQLLLCGECPHPLERSQVIVERFSDPSMEEKYLKHWSPIAMRRLRISWPFMLLSQLLQISNRMHRVSETGSWYAAISLVVSVLLAAMTAGMFWKAEKDPHTRWARICMWKQLLSPIAVLQTWGEWQVVFVLKIVIFTLWGAVIAGDATDYVSFMVMYASFKLLNIVYDVCHMHKEAGTWQLNIDQAISSAFLLVFGAYTGFLIVTRCHRQMRLSFLLGHLSLSSSQERKDFSAQQSARIKLETSKNDRATTEENEKKD